jgi:hypothetical protein
MMTRRRALAFGGALLAGLRGRPASAAATRPLVTRVVVSAGRPFAGDHELLTTISPGGPGERPTARLGVGLSARAHLRVDVVNRNAPGVHAAVTEGATAAGQPSLVRLFDRAVGRGLHEVQWTPPATTAPGTYSLVVTVTDSRGNRSILGAASPAHPLLPAAPVVRVIGIDATFTKRGYRPGEVATLRIAAFAETLSVEILRVGPEEKPIYANDAVAGVTVGEPLSVDWRANRDAPATVSLPLGDWPSGVYFAKLTAEDGRTGYAPFVLRPAAPTARVAVVMPTNTWQAYNFYDADGDGFGDSWYVSLATATIDLARPHLHRGVPYRFRSYDLTFLRWLAHTGKDVDFYSDEDIGTFATGDDLRSAYDLVVFPGHAEYVTGHVYTVVERYRDLGGNLAFLSSDNFFRRVDRKNDKLKLVGLWRELGRPEAGLLGVQYRASDRGTHQHPFVVTPAGAAAGWPFAGTSLVAGSSFGLYGIEVDATSPASPPGTQVLAEIPDALGPGLTAQMSYYETPAGARVFSAGVLNFGGQALLWPESTALLENVWRRLTED